MAASCYDERLAMLKHGIRGPAFRGPAFRGPAFRGPAFRNAAFAGMTVYSTPIRSGDGR